MHDFVHLVSIGVWGFGAWATAGHGAVMVSDFTGLGRLGACFEDFKLCETYSV